MTSPRIRLPHEWATTLAFLAVHLVMAATVPLVQDEAYYTLWSQHLDWGYYDHPPMVAWWIAAGRAVLGETTLGVRFVSVLGMAALGLMAAAIARQISGQAQAGRIAALFANGTLLVFGLGFVATPDAPSAFFWALAVWAMVRASDATGRSAWGWWALVGFAAGAGVISKLSGLFLGVGLVIWLFGTKAGRGWLARPHPWMAGAVALLVMAPYLLWNWQLDWLGFERQFGRVGGGGFSFETIAGYLVLLPLALSPAIAWATARNIRKAGSVVLALNLPVLAYFLWHATHAGVAGNWLVPVCAPLAAVGAVWATRWRGWQVWTAALFGPALVSALLALALSPGAKFGRADTPPNQTKAWDQIIVTLAPRIVEARAQWIVTDHYGLAGLLGWYTGMEVRDLAQTYRYTYLPPLDAYACDRPGLLVLKYEDPAAVGAFENLRPMAPVLRVSGQHIMAVYQVYAFDRRVGC